MRLQFSLIQLLQVVTFIGLTLGLDLWLIENRAAVLILIAWSGLIGAFLAVRSFHNIGAPAYGGIALVIAAVTMFTNGVALAFVAPGVVLPPSPSNPFPLKNLEHFELWRTVLIATLMAGIVGFVFGLLVGAIFGTAHSDARKQ